MEGGWNEAKQKFGSLLSWTSKFYPRPSFFVLRFQQHLRGFDQKVYQHYSGGCARGHAAKSPNWWRVLVHQGARCLSPSSCARGLGAWWKLLGDWRDRAGKIGTKTIPLKSWIRYITDITYSTCMYVCIYYIYICVHTYIYNIHILVYIYTYHISQ